MFRDRIVTIIEEAGSDVLSDPDRFKAYVGDLCQDYPKERDFLIAACDEEYIQLFDVLDKTEDVRFNNTRLAANFLTEKKMIAEKWADYISTEIMEGVSLYIDKKNDLNKVNKDPAGKDEINAVMEENTQTLKALQELLDEQYTADNKEAASLTEKKEKEEININKLRSEIDQLTNRIESLEKEKLQIDPFFHWMKAAEIDESINYTKNRLKKQQSLLNNAYERYEKYIFSLRSICDTESINSDHIDALVKCIDMIKAQNEKLKMQLEAD